MKKIFFVVLFYGTLSFTASAFHDLKAGVHCATCTGIVNCYACKQFINAVVP